MTICLRDFILSLVSMLAPFLRNFNRKISNKATHPQRLSYKLKNTLGNRITWLPLDFVLRFGTKNWPGPWTNSFGHEFCLALSWVYRKPPSNYSRMGACICQAFLPYRCWWRFLILSKHILTEGFQYIRSWSSRWQSERRNWFKARTD